MHRQAAIAVMCTGVLVSAGLVSLQVVRSSGQQMSAWVVTRDVAAGAVVDRGAAQEVSLPVGNDPINVAAQSPVGHRAAHLLRAGDMVRPDDLLGRTTVEVPATFKVAPPLSVGDTVDVYLADGPSTPTTGMSDPLGGAQTTAPRGVHLLACAIPVVAVGSDGAPHTLAVPASQEDQWVRVSAQGSPLIAVRTPGTCPTGGAGISAALRPGDQAP